MFILMDKGKMRLPGYFENKMRQPRFEFPILRFSGHSLFARKRKASGFVKQILTRGKAIYWSNRSLTTILLPHLLSGNKDD